MSAVSKEKPVYKIFTDEELKAIISNGLDPNILEIYNETYAKTFADLYTCEDKEFIERIKFAIEDFKKKGDQSDLKTTLPPINKDHCTQIQSNIMPLCAGDQKIKFSETIKQMNDLILKSSPTQENKDSTEEKGSSISSKNHSPVTPDLYHYFLTCYAYTEVNEFVGKLYETDTNYSFSPVNESDEKENSNKTAESTLLLTVIDSYSSTTTPKPIKIT